VAFYLMVGIPYGIINLWIVWWFWRALRGAGTLQVLVCLVIVALALCFPLTYKRPESSDLMVALVRAGAVWTGVFIYFFLLIFLLDAWGLAARVMGWEQAIAPRYGLCFFLLLVVAGVTVTGWINAAKPVLREYSLVLKTRNPALLADGGKTLTLAALGDMHMGRTITAERFSRAIDLLVPHKPDAVFFLGDIIDDHILLDVPAMASAVGRLQAPLGVWGIAGNHEYISGPIEKSIAILEDSGINMLCDEWTNLGGALLVAGRDDYSRSRFTDSERKTLPEILRGVPETTRSLPLLVLDHQPYHLEEAEAAGAALQLSGHTHTGQLWPFNHVIASLYENPHGLSTRGDTHYIVTVGVGTWGPPIRTNARPEVLLLRISFAEAE
jgi:predicted MPP superfamily phosphohydrolase